MVCPCVGSVALEWHPFGLAFSSPFSQESRIAVTSFETSGSNFLQLFRVVGPSVISDGRCETRFPQTCVRFSPGGGEGAQDLAVTCGDSLKVWRVEPGSASLAGDVVLSETPDPLTCVDWSLYDDSVVLTGSTDATATAVDLARGQVIARIIAHDHPVHDVCFCGASSTFVTAGFDGSLRFFDLRDLQTSLIWYQTAMPLMRACVSPLDASRAAVFAKGSRSVVVIDARRPGVAAATIEGHDAPVTCIGWSKLGSGGLYSSDESGGIFLGDLSSGALDVMTRKWWAASAGPVESFAIGQGVIAAAIGNHVTLIEAPRSAVASPSCN